MRCRRSRVLLLCFTDQFFSLRCRRRRRVLPLSFIYLLLRHLFSSSSYLRSIRGFFVLTRDLRLNCHSDLRCSRLLFTAWESKMCSNRSVVTPQVNHVVCLNYHTVQLFIFPTRRSQGSLLFRYFLECCLERHKLLSHQPRLLGSPLHAFQRAHFSESSPSPSWALFFVSGSPCFAHVSGLGRTCCRVSSNLRFACIRRVVSASGLARVSVSAMTFAASISALLHAVGSQPAAPPPRFGAFRFFKRNSDLCVISDLHEL